ncbi:MAG: GNAT family N-acetyltransferase [Myxococcaceae bacterium]
MARPRVVLETERLTLREMNLDDLDAVAAMLADPEVMRFWPRPQTREEAEAWVLRQVQRYASHGFGYWLAFGRESGELAGQAGLLPTVVEGVEEVGLGYILHRSAWGRGLATEAARGCVAHAFGLGKERVVALVRPENRASVHVAERLGMKLERKVTFSGFEHAVYVAERSVSGAPGEGAA